MRALVLYSFFLSGCVSRLKAKNVIVKCFPMQTFAGLYFIANLHYILIYKVCRKPSKKVHNQHNVYIPRFPKATIDTF